MTPIIFISIGIILAFDDALIFKWDVIKTKHYIFTKYEWWFNPAISWRNKYKNKWWKFFTPLSDQKHVNRVLIWLLIMTLVILPQLLWWESLICGVAGVYLGFNLTWYLITKENK